MTNPNKRWAVLLAACAVLAAAPAAQARPPAPTEQVQLNKARIDAALADMVKTGRATGAAALVWKDGREVYYGQTGLADREANRPWSRDTLVQIYSMTKPVTGVALMQLWEQGKFKLDDPLATYLPEFANMQVQTEPTRRATPSGAPPNARSPSATSSATRRALPMAPAPAPQRQPS